MKKMIPLFLAAVALPLSAGEAKVLYSEDFEQQVPGRAPEQWKKAWGNPGKDVVAVSSEKSASGEKSMEISHFDDPGQWGLGLKLPDAKQGKMVIEYKILLDGPGSQCAPGFELRDRKKGMARLAGWGFGNSKFHAFSYLPSAKKPRGRIGNVAANTWYTVRVTVPLTAADGAFFRSELENPATGEKCSGEFDMVHSPEMSMYLNLPPKKTDYKVYIDDVKVSVEE